MCCMLYNNGVHIVSVCRSVDMSASSNAVTILMIE